MAQTKPKAGQFYGVSNNGTDGQFLKTDGTGGMSWDSPITNPTITSIDYPGSQTAADPAGGESVIINGTLFASGITCTIGGTSAVTAFNSATQITITTPAKAAGQYAVAVANLNGGTASEVNFIQYSGVPVWSTASGNIGSVQSGLTASFQVTATEGSDTIEYAVTTGSLPSGLSLNTNTGAITGTAGSVSASTTTTFSITATDDENQTSSARSFNITVTPDLPSNHFNTVLYTGNGASSMSITGVGFQPDFVWIKRRDGGGNHYVFDTIRGVYNALIPDDAYAEINNSNYLTSFDSDGFSLGSNGALVGSNQTYAAWNFKGEGAAAANTDGTIASQVIVNNTLGFSIVKYDGAGLSGSASTVGHGLDAAPELMFVKVYESGLTATSWFVYSATAGNAKEAYLNLSSAFLSDANRWNSTSPTSTVFTLGSSFSSYPSYYGGDTIAYCFTSKPGFSKVGSYTGNASASGPIVQTGFEPAFLLIKGTQSTTQWLMIDNKRSTSNPRNKALFANLVDAEGTNNSINFFTNGFQPITTDGDSNRAETYIYLAFAADPSTTTPSLANSFQNFTWSGSGSAGTKTGLNFQPDAIFWKAYNSSSYNWKAVDSVRGKSLNATTYNNLYPNLTNAQNSDNALSAINANNIEFNSGGNGNVSGLNYIGYSWKAGGLKSINTDGTITSLVSANDAAGFSIVEYQTSGVQSIGHGLSSAPELVIQKSLDVSGGSYWGVYSAVSGMGTGKLLRLNENSSVFTDSYFFSAVGNSTFTTSWSGTVYKYINYCFRSITGYSKVGSYVGTGTTISAINVGFTPGFVMIKGIDNSGNWAMLDNKRGGTSRNQLDANDSHAEYANQGVTFTSTGFSPRQSVSSDTNTSGITYLYLAIKEN